nr:M23 family metallopeptidase [Asticcacaulis sp. AC402]
MLDIDHGGGVVTRYNDLGDFEVKIGDTVAVAQEGAKTNPRRP